MLRLQIIIISGRPVNIMQPKQTIIFSGLPQFSPVQEGSEYCQLSSLSLSPPDDDDDNVAVAAPLGSELGQS